MAKRNMLKLCVAIALTMSASSAFAGITSSVIIGGGTYAPSNKVEIKILSTSTEYAAKSGHTAGDRTVFTNNIDPKLYWTTKVIGAAPATVSNATETQTTWTSL